MNNVFKFPTAEERKIIKPFVPKITSGVAEQGDFENFGVLKGDVFYADSSLPIRDGDFVIFIGSKGKQMSIAKERNGEMFIGDFPKSQLEIVGRVFRLERDY